MIKMTKKQAKALVSGLRRSLKDLDSTQISHSAACELLAKSLGFKNWSALNATLAEDSPESLTNGVPMQTKYPLSNTGQFDFALEGVLLVGTNFQELVGTLEDIFDCTAGVSSATRKNNGTVDIEYEGGTEVNWDCQKTRFDSRGFRIWIEAQNYTFVSEDRCVLVPEDEAAAIDLEDPNIELVVRHALVEALATYLQEIGQVPEAIRQLESDPALTSALVYTAETAIEFSATHPERAQLLKQLQKLVK